jgi:hypothetical protein
MKVPRLFAQMAFLRVNRYGARDRRAAPLTTIFVWGKAEQTFLADRFGNGIKQNGIADLTDTRKKRIYKWADRPNDSVQPFVDY